MSIRFKSLCVLPVLVVLASCASQQPSQIDEKRQVFDINSIPNSGDKIDLLTVQTMSPIYYACDKGGSVIVDAKNDSATIIDATFPDIGLNQKTIRLYREAATSGERYVDTLNPDSTIEWLTQSNEALFSVQWDDGVNYQAQCDVQ